jgi:hypothetical protein
MKLIKVILPLALLGMIGFATYKSCVHHPPPDEISLPINQSTKRIDSLTKVLNKAPVNTFCLDRYKNINYYIDEDHKNHFFSQNDQDNNQWKEILSKNLYSAYAPKFAEQAMYIFTGSEWKINDLNIISNEVKMLQSSVYLQTSSEVGKKFRDINSILVKYDEIANFISICNNFSYPRDGINDQYPNVSDMIQKSRAYIGNNLENEYVNNCIRLKDGLQEIPKKLFYEHVSYLRSKIEKNVGSYKAYASHLDYNNQLYTPLIKQINVLSDDVYGINDDTIDDAINDLTKLLEADNENAYKFFTQN